MNGSVRTTDSLYSIVRKDLVLRLMERNISDAFFRSIARATKGHEPKQRQLRFHSEAFQRTRVGGFSPLDEAVVSRASGICHRIRVGWAETLLEPAK